MTFCKSFAIDGSNWYYFLAITDDLDSKDRGAEDEKAENKTLGHLTKRDFRWFYVRDRRKLHTRSHYLLLNSVRHVIHYTAIFV